MPDLEFVLVEPLYEGNIGFAARVIRNFGFDNLTLINPPELTVEARARASHAFDTLANARVCSSVEEVIETSNLVVATTGALSLSVTTAMRMPYYTPRELATMLEGTEGRISILFGRENWGLSNEEVEKADIICTIPTDPGYPIVNISHAVGIVAYECANIPRGEYPLASRIELDSLYDHFSRFLDNIDHPNYKRNNTLTMIRRIFSRTMLTTREVTTLHGLMRRAEYHLGALEGENGDGE